MCKSLVGSDSFPSPSGAPSGSPLGDQRLPHCTLDKKQHSETCKDAWFCLLGIRRVPVASPEASENQNMLSPDALLL